MAKTKISEFSATPGNNTDIDGINIAEGCAPSGINDAIRELMAQLKDFQAGTAGDSFNGPIGSTTAAAGAFTTLTTSGAVTHNGGTANGVAYLNGSKVLTTGSALTFDGSTFSLSGGAITSTDSAGNARSKFEVFTNGQTNNQITLGQGFAGPTDNVGYLYNRANAAFVFGVNNAEQMRLTNTGLGIGTSSPGYKLDVTGTIRATTGVISSGNVSAGGLSGDGALSTVRSDNTSAIASAINFGRGTAAGTGFNISTTGDGANGVTSFLIRKDGTSWVNLTDGNLGLGVTPSAWRSVTKVLQINNAAFRVDTDASSFVNNAFINSSNQNIYINNGFATSYAQTSGQHLWFTAPSGTAGNAISFTQAMTLTSGGDLLVGRTSAVANEGFNVTKSVADYVVRTINSNATPYGLVVNYSAATPNGAGNEFLRCVDSTTDRMTVRSNGGIANFSANNVNLSDVRTKTDIQPATSYLDKICAIPVKTFLYKDQTDTERNLGVIAQDVDAVAPELIDHSGFGEAPEGESPYLAVYQTDLQYALMKCIQEQQALITDLRARVAALEAA